MKQKKFLKVATLGILTTLMLGVSSYVSAASGHAYCAGYSGNDLGTTSMTTNAYNTYRSLGYSSNYTISPSFNTLKSGKFSDGTKYLESKVLFLAGHGAKDGSSLHLATSYTGIRTGNSSLNEVGINEINFNNTKLVTLAGCYTSVNDSSLAVEIYRKGSDNVIGWRQEVNPGAMTDFLENYHKKLKSGSTVWDALVYAGTFSYSDSRVKDVGFFGSANNTIKSASNISTMSSSEDEIVNPNTYYVTEDINFTNDNQNLNEIISLIKSKDSLFKIEDYEVRINELNKEQNLYIIDFIRKIGNFYTDLGYVVTVKDGKVTTLTNNNREILPTISKTLSNNTISSENLNSYKKIAIKNLMQKSFKDFSLGTFNNKDIIVKEQLGQLYFDVNTNKPYYKIFTTYEDENGFVDVDYYLIDLEK